MLAADPGMETEVLDLAPLAGEMAARVRATDWHASALGPPALWDASLRRAVQGCLAAREPVLFWCGPARVLVYNDAAVPLLGERAHPGAFARPGQVLRGLWERCGSAIDAVFAGQPARWDELLPVYVERTLPSEEIYLRMTFIPVRSDDGRRVLGVLCPCREITAQVIAARRSATLSALRAQGAYPRPVLEAADSLVSTLVEQGGDASFAALYWVRDDGREANRVAAAGRMAPEPSHSIARCRGADAGAPHGRWPVYEGAELVPVLRPFRRDQLLALLLIGTGAHRPADASHEAFLQHVAACVGSVLVGSEREAGGASDLSEALAPALEVGRSRGAPRRALLDPSPRASGEPEGLLREQLAYVASVTAMGELAASLSHHLNQPLAALVTNAQACLRWLTHSPPNLGEVTAAAQRIVHDAHHASHLLVSTHAFLRRARRRHTLLDLPAMIHEVLEMVQSELQSQDIRSRLTLASVAPAALGDRVQIQQVLLNLVVNAVEAMTGPAAPTPRILEVSVEAHADGAPCVAVSDSGTGIAAARRADIFDAFYTTKPASLGMGLAISKSIVEAHGGRIWATPNPTRGETFRFTLRRPRS